MAWYPDETSLRKRDGDASHDDARTTPLGFGAVGCELSDNTWCVSATRAWAARSYDELHTKLVQQGEVHSFCQAGSSGAAASVSGGEALQ